MLIRKLCKTKTLSVRIRQDVLDQVVDIRAELADYGFTIEINKVCAAAIETALEQARRELEELRRKNQAAREV